MKTVAVLIDNVVARYEQRAVDRAQEGSHAAGVYARVARELREDFAVWRDTEVTAEQAATLCGYTANGLRAWMRRHQITQLTMGMLPQRPVCASEDDAEPDEAVDVAAVRPAAPRRPRKPHARPVQPSALSLATRQRVTGAMAGAGR